MDYVAIPAIGFLFRRNVNRNHTIPTRYGFRTSVGNMADIAADIVIWGYLGMVAIQRECGVYMASIVTCWRQCDVFL